MTAIMRFIKGLKDCDVTLGLNKNCETYVHKMFI